MDSSVRWAYSPNYHCLRISLADRQLLAAQSLQHAAEQTLNSSRASWSEQKRALEVWFLNDQPVTLRTILSSCSASWRISRSRTRCCTRTCRSWAQMLSRPSAPACHRHRWLVFEHNLHLLAFCFFMMFTQAWRGCSWSSTSHR